MQKRLIELSEQRGRLRERIAHQRVISRHAVQRIGADATEQFIGTQSTRVGHCRSRDR